MLSTETKNSIPYCLINNQSNLNLKSNNFRINYEKNEINDYTKDNIQDKFSIVNDQYEYLEKLEDQKKHIIYKFPNLDYNENCEVFQNNPSKKKIDKDNNKNAKYDKEAEIIVDNKDGKKITYKKYDYYVSKDGKYHHLYFFKGLKLLIFVMNIDL